MVVVVVLVLGGDYCWAEIPAVWHSNRKESTLHLDRDSVHEQVTLPSVSRPFDWYGSACMNDGLATLHLRNS